MYDVEHQLLLCNIAERNHHNGSTQLQSAIHAELESMRKELARHQADRDNIFYELKAVNHHRTVLRDAPEQLERAVKNQADTIADLEFQVERLQGRTGSRSGAAVTAAGLDI